VTDFKVGDEVSLNTRAGARAVVEYGPYGTDKGTYLVKLLEGDDAGDIFPALGYVMKPVPAFAVGDKVAYEYGGGGTLVAGPFKSEYHDEAIWVVEKSNGTHMTPTENSLRKVDAEPTREIKVGDRVRVVNDDRCTKPGEFIGRTGRVLEAKSAGRALPFRVKLDDPSGTWYSNGTWWVEEVELVDEPADTYEYDGVTYNISAKYRDRDGDVWRFERRPNGDVRGTWRTGEVGDWHSKLEDVATECGPLTKIDD
jgi:hypothetical protein